MCRHVPCRGIRFARACREIDGNETLDEAVMQQAVQLAERMQRPEMVRVWTYKYGSGYQKVGL